MISIELLSEVLGKEVKYYEDIKCFYRWNEEALNWATKEIGRWQPIDINIHELAHKCKEWAYSDGIMLQSYLYNDKARCDIEKFGVFEHEFQVADTEPESIFKACEWILEQLKQKDE